MTTKTADADDGASVSSLIPIIVGKTNNIGNIHMNTYRTTPNMTETEREIYMIHITMKQYALKTGLIKFKERE